MTPKRKVPRSALTNQEKHVQRMLQAGDRLGLRRTLDTRNAAIMDRFRKERELTTRSRGRR